MREVTLDGSGSSEPDEAEGDSIVRYAWDIDSDGNYDDASGELPGLVLSPTELARFGIDAPGSFPISLRVTDTFGATGVLLAGRRYERIGNGNAVFGFDTTADADGARG